MYLSLCNLLKTTDLTDLLFDKRPEQLNVAEFVRLTEPATGRPDTGY